MKKLLAALLVALCLVLVAEAKRAAPKEVLPIYFGSLKITAPNTVADMGWIEVRDIRTDRLLLKKRVYSIAINPRLEADVQWVFIVSMKIADGALRVTDERGRTYRLNLKDFLEEVIKGCTSLGGTWRSQGKSPLKACYFDGNKK